MGSDGLTHGVDEATAARLAAFAAMLPPEVKAEPAPADDEFEVLDQDVLDDLAEHGDDGVEAKYDTSPVGKPGGKQNWVDKAGGLPAFIRAVAHALIKTGKSESTAIAIAVGRVRAWARGGGNVSAATQAKAAAAIAEFEAKAKGSKSMGSETEDQALAYRDDQGVVRVISEAKAAERGPYTATREVYTNNFGDYPVVEFTGGPETKAAMLADGSWDFDASALGLLPDADPDREGTPTGAAAEYKEVGAQVLDVDRKRGIVTAIVSVTGKQDRVKDVIHPGAYTKTLAERKPKGVWSHSWEQPVSKTLESRELRPGDPSLPKTMRGPAGKPVPWPSDAGGLLVKTQFNLLGDRGKQAFADVVFFGDDQEWSIGYNVPPGGSRTDMKSGVRHIYEVDLYEYSPVLFGAMPAAATVNVKSAQLAFKAADEASRAIIGADELAALASLRSGVEVKGWAEMLHPRDPSGQFTASQGSGYKAKGKDDATVSSEQENVKTLQAALVKLGLLSKDSGKNGGVDGLYGPKTTAAIKAYQEKNGLPVTGKADAKTLASLAKSDGHKDSDSGDGKASGGAAKPATAAATGAKDKAPAPAAGKAPASADAPHVAAGARDAKPTPTPADAKPAADAVPAAGAPKIAAGGSKVPLASRPDDGKAPDVNYDDGTGTGWKYKPGPSSIMGSGGVVEDGVPLTNPAGAKPVDVGDGKEVLYEDGSVFTPDGWSDSVAPPAAVKKAADARNATRQQNGLDPLPLPDYATGKSPGLTAGTAKKDLPMELDRAGWPIEAKGAFPGAAAPFGSKDKGSDDSSKAPGKDDAKNEDGTAPDKGKPHKFAPDAHGKCKVCGLAFGGHMKAQRASATGEKSDDFPVEVKAYQPCPECGANDWDEFVDGSVVCDECGYVLQAAGTEQKAGRVLSSVNASSLRSVYDVLNSAVGSLGDLLGKAGVDLAESKSLEGVGAEFSDLDLDLDPVVGGELPGVDDVDYSAVEAVEIEGAAEAIVDPEVKSEEPALISEFELLMARRIALTAAD